MGMDVTATKAVKSSNCTHASKADFKKDDITGKQAVIQDLGPDTFVKSSEQDTTKLTYQPVQKKLSPEEIKALKDEQENLKADLVKRFIRDTINNQNKLLGKSTESGSYGMPKATSSLLTKIFGSVENAYPPLATTQEGAAKAIAEGGAYSVNAVADRIMTMAKAIAGDDPNKLQEMRAAVEKGFTEAGAEFSKATNNGLPQICKDTISEVMRRFDELQNKTSSTK